MLQAQYEMIERQADQRSIPEQRRQLESDLNRLEHRVAESRATFLAKVADQRVKALQKVAVIDQTLRKARQREGLRRLAASVAPEAALPLTRSEVQDPARTPPTPAGVRALAY